jgi:hypothetical protein
MEILPITRKKFLFKPGIPRRLLPARHTAIVSAL